MSRNIDFTVNTSFFFDLQKINFKKKFYNFFIVFQKIYNFYYAPDTYRL